MAYSDTVLASTPFFYLPMDETSGTTAADAVASLDGTCSGLTMGGGDGPSGYRSTDGGGIGGKAPVFTGSQHITLAADKVLGGSSEWTVSAWVFPTQTDSLEHVFYGEMSTVTGNDRIMTSLKGPAAGQQMMHTYGNDPSYVLNGSNSVFIVGVWSLVHYIWRSGGIAEVWWNGGQRGRFTGGSSGATWTNSNLATWIGGPPRSGLASGWVGRIAHLFGHKRALTKPEMSTLYRAGTPLTRPLLDLNPLWTPTGPWNQALDDPNNVPDIASGSAATVQKLANQVVVAGVGSGVSGPCFVVDNGESTERVRLQGGQDNYSTDKPALYNAFGLVPTPDDLTSSAGGDASATIVNTDSNELWEFWQLQRSLLAPEWVSATPAAGGSMTVSATPYAYVVYPSDGTGAIGVGRSAAATVTAGNQTVNLSWGTSEGATKYRIYRRLNTGGSSGGNFMVQVDGAVHAWTDTGSITPGAANTAAAAVVTTDWGASYGGYLADITDSPGHYEAPRANWGTTATSLPLIAGTIMLEEAYSSGDIEHALCMDLNSTTDTHVYPAQRHDFFGGANAIPEGTRFQLDPTIDVTTISSNPLTQRIMRALQKYGMIARDFAGAVSGCFFEGAESIGRDPYPELFSGALSYELLTQIPWARMQVIDTAWTLAQVEADPPPVTPLFEEFTDDFEDGVIDTDKWTITGTATESAGALHIPIKASPYNKLTTTGGPYSLVDSAIYWRTSQRPYADGADQSGVTLAAAVDAVHCQVRFWIESSVGVGLGGGLKFQYINSAHVGVEVAAVELDAVAHAWQRVRESAGVVYAETSPDGVVWVPFASFLWSATGWAVDALASVNAIVFAGNYNAVAGRPDLVVESFNVSATPDPPPPPVGGVLVAAPPDVRVTGQGLANRKVRVLEVTAPEADDYLVPSTQFGLAHIDLLVGPANVSDITYPASGTSVRFHAEPADGVTVPFTVRVMAVGGDH